ncbi:MAG: hypothetical protein EKK53_02215 [Burkholderiales bacterium]|nr:MAG: hypothetical protein EKK53_02215 [Burkholderiales bacterium]
MQNALLRMLSWSLLIGCWLSLGAIGQSLSPLQAGGLLPVVAALACGGLLLHWWHASRRPGWFDCFLPPGGGIPWRRPAAWPKFCARCAMLPMMATLVLMGQWCSASGLAPWQTIALHLSAMLLPALLLRSRGSPVLIASAMGMGMALLLVLQGIKGLMALSLCQSIAWGIAQSTPAVPASAGHRRHWGLALIPALTTLALGLGIDAAGPKALETMQVTLSFAACAGFLLAPKAMLETEP